MKKWAAIFLFALASGAHASGETIIRADGEAHARVQNDDLSISLYFEKDGENPAELNRDVEREAARAMARAKRVASVRIATAGYSIVPIYEKQHVTGQRANYRLTLETRDFDAGLSLASRLQPFQIASLNFSVSRSTRESMQKKLLQEAIVALRQKLDIVKHSIGASSIAITEISIGGSMPTQPHLMSMSRMAVEPGESDVSVSVSGTALAR